MVYYMPMNALAEQLNAKLGSAADMLSPVGRRIYFPYGGILGQGAEAKTCAINATIGMAFEEDGSPLVMDCFAGHTDLDRKAFLYAGSFGLLPLREAWKKMQVKKNPTLRGKNYSLPVVTNALTHGLRITGELFAGPGDEVVAPDLYWDNYSLIFEEVCGAKLTTFNMFRAGAFDVAAMKRALLAPGEKKILVLNFPVKAVAARGKKIVVVLDDAYFGLVYEKGVHAESLFAEFADLHPNVLAVKLDGTTKEDYVWGLRVGFISFAWKGATEEQLQAMAAKAAGDVRSGISNATSIGQHLALKAYADSAYAKQKREKYAVLKKRYRIIRQLLKSHPEWRDLFEPMPFNSGYFMCVKPKGVDAESVRRQLIAKYSTGTIVLSGLIRLAFSTTSCAKLPTLFSNVAAAVGDVRLAQRARV